MCWWWLDILVVLIYSIYQPGVVVVVVVIYFGGAGLQYISTRMVVVVAVSWAGWVNVGVCALFTHTNKNGKLSCMIYLVIRRPKTAQLSKITQC